ncbi:MAG: hypothetical protein MSG64_08310 [Pyrinomonadaceae bacterium MAG19_C2-C3]|nr:hypothetical protein [Pyrinomonadaceae bacterium MAG19_C2-C3]
MKKQLTMLSLAACCLFAATTTITAQVSKSKRAQSSAPMFYGGSTGSHYHSSFASMEFAFGGQVVKGAPYSALAVKETFEITPDGKRITRRDAAQLYRDGEGRTRIERGFNGNAASPLNANSSRAAFITDADGFYFLDPRGRTALKFSSRGKASISGTGASVTTQADPRSVAGDMTEALGTQIIEGVTAQGFRTTTNIAAGEARNAAPVRIVYERWYAPELRRDVLIKCTDTRFGEAIFRLTDISRAEPASVLFAIPADFKIEELGFGTRTRK